MQPKEGYMVLNCFRLSFILSLFIAFPSVAKNRLTASDSSFAILSKYEDTLETLQQEKIKPQTTDTYRQQASDKFYDVLKRALLVPGSFNYPFDSLKTISRLTSPDKKFKILNWNISKQDGTYKYYGFIQVKDEQKSTYKLIELHDEGNDIANPELATGTADKWFGMLYYKIIPCLNEANTYYLLGWQGHNNLVTRKIIDVISFNSQGVPTFGKTVFKHPPAGCKSTYKRILFQFGASVFMSLKYDEAKKMIVFDHLAPPDPGLTGQYQFYGPSFQVDALAYKDNQWVYVENVDARNAASRNDKNYHPETEDFQKPKKPVYSPSH